MCLGCLVSGDKAGVEKAVGAEPGSLIAGVAIGKARPNPKVIEKQRQAKATII